MSRPGFGETTWRKSSRSNGAANCVEVAAVQGWRKSSRSSGNSDCVEVAAGLAVAVRDSKEPDGPQLASTPGAWAAFTHEVKIGTFDS